jgi:hypothetical protein
VLPPSSVMRMMETARTSETSVDNYFTRQYIPEDNSEFMSVSFSIHSRGSSLPQVHRLCRFTRPDRWNVAPSLKTNLFIAGYNLTQNWNLFSWFVTWFVFRNNTLNELWVMKYQNWKTLFTDTLYITLNFAHTVYLWVSYDSRNNQWLLTNWSF